MGISSRTRTKRSKWESPKSVKIETPARQEFFDVTNAVRGVRRRALGLRDGLAVAYTAHTSCCVVLQEESEDITYYGTQLLLQDTLNVLAKIAPPTRHEGQYLHPGPIHIRNAAELRGRAARVGAQHRRPHHLLDPRAV